jgi:hypothetical protein
MLATAGVAIATSLAAVADAAAVDEPVTIDNDLSPWEYLVGGAQIVAAVAAAVGIPILVRTLKATSVQLAFTEIEIETANADARIQRSLSFQDQYANREFRMIASRAFAYVDVDDAADAVDKIRAWRRARHAEDPALPRSPRDAAAPQASKNDVQQVLNFFEMLGTAHNNELLVDEVLDQTFGTIPVQIFCAAWWHVCWLRGGCLHDETQLYIQFEGLVKDLRARPDLAAMAPNAKVRLLMLPAEGQGDRTWRLARRLSAALSARLQSGESMGELLTAVRCAKLGIRVGAAPQCGLFGEILAVPPTFDVDLADWAGPRDDAQRLLKPLGELDEHGVERLIVRLS